MSVVEFDGAAVGEGDDVAVIRRFDGDDGLFFGFRSDFASDGEDDRVEALRGLSRSLGASGALSSSNGIEFDLVSARSGSTSQMSVGREGESFGKRSGCIGGNADAGDIVGVASRGELIADFRSVRNELDIECGAISDSEFATFNADRVFDVEGELSSLGDPAVTHHGDGDFARTDGGRSAADDAIAAEGQTFGQGAAANGVGSEVGAGAFERDGDVFA